MRAPIAELYVRIFATVIYTLVFLIPERVIGWLVIKHLEYNEEDNFDHERAMRFLKEENEEYDLERGISHDRNIKDSRAGTAWASSGQSGERFRDRLDGCEVDGRYGLLPHLGLRLPADLRGSGQPSVQPGKVIDMRAKPQQQKTPTRMSRGLEHDGPQSA